MKSDKIIKHEETDHDNAAIMKSDKIVKCEETDHDNAVIIESDKTVKCEETDQELQNMKRLIMTLMLQKSDKTVKH